MRKHVLTHEERALVAQAEAIKARLAKSKTADRKKGTRERKNALGRTEGQRNPPTENPAYLSWVHDWICIACELRGPAPSGLNHIEAAHQKHTDKRGATTGRTSSDETCVPLCEYHHRTGPDCCDPAQARFWRSIGVDIAAFSREMFAAFKARGNGNEVVRKFVELARAAA